MLPAWRMSSKSMGSQQTREGHIVFILLVSEIIVSILTHFFGCGSQKGLPRFKGNTQTLPINRSTVKVQKEKHPV